MEEQNPTIEASEVHPQAEKFNFLAFAGKNFLALSILASGVLISGSVLYTGGGSLKAGTAQIQQQAQPDEPGSIKVEVSVDDDPVLGSANAPVTIIEFSDFQCPFCRVFWKESYGQLKKEYIDTGKVKLVFRDYPLSFHAMGGPSGEAAECADDQGKFWEYHDKIFEEQDKLGQGTVTYTAQDLKSWAVQLKLDSAKFNSCLDSEKYKDEVAKDTADGSSAGVTGTPSFFINGRMVVGAQPYSVFKTIIEEELNK